MFSMAEADDVLPKSRNHGLKPSEDLAEMIRQCCKILSSVLPSFLDRSGWRTCGM